MSPPIYEEIRPTMNVEASPNPEEVYEQAPQYPEDGCTQVPRDGTDLSDLPRFDGTYIEEGLRSRESQPRDSIFF